MVHLSRIYTRTGDDGSTGLGDGARVSKCHPRVAAYGEADETGAAIGLAALHCGEDAATLAALRRAQNDLFDLGADLCIPLAADEKPGAALRIRAEQTLRLEREIDAANASLKPLKSFVLSGGSPLGAHLHLARCVARRCERRVVELAAVEPLNPEAIRYVNRLSDWLFVLARRANQADGGEILWAPGGGAQGPA